ncbi:MAG: lytic murein transglycosylase [Enterobacteriaceae bacterium]
MRAPKMVNLAGYTLLFSFSLLSGCTAEPVKPPPVQGISVAQQAVPPAVIGFDGPRVESEFPVYIEKLKEYALQHGIDAKTVDDAFSQVHFVSRAIKSDRGQLEKKITLDIYLQRVLPASKIAQTRQKYQEYYSQLQSAGTRYGVDASVIAALWGMESSFGRIQGKEDIISAMSTLAFEGRREAFFVRELMAALQILQKGYIDREQLKGSWAGAMGQCQFMPSSYLKYGVDSDGTGHIDIWNNTRDIFASMANYLATEGWQEGQPWGEQIILPAGFSHELEGVTPEKAKSVAQWRDMGIRAQSGQPLPDIAQAWIIIPEDNQGRAFMVYDNFRTLMHWNRSYFFAISVGMLSDALNTVSSGTNQ